VDEGAKVGAGFDSAAEQYDEVLRHNREGAHRLVAALPDGRYDDVLDVGCGTGFVSEEMVARFGSARITGVDPSAGMLERFREKLAGLPVEATLIQAGVHDMDVPDAAFDAVVSGMAFHWFPEKPAALGAMTRRLRPGGVLGILASGTGTDDEFRVLLEAIEPPVPRGWVDVFGAIHRSGEELAGYMEDAGLEVIDVWEERRVRRVAPEAFLARITAVSSHLSADLDPEEAAAHGARVVEAVMGATGPRGFRYTFVKLFGVGRRPA
jgi:trans-aconitate methyltransferase